MKIFLCTAGTSIATNKGIDISDLENQPSSKRAGKELELLNLRQSVQAHLSRVDLKRDLERTSAEIKSLAKMGLERRDRVYLLVSDTLDGEACAALNKEYLEQGWGCEVVLEPIHGLQAVDGALFRREGLKNLLGMLIQLLDEHSFRELRINVTAGFKSIIPYVTLLGMIYGRPVMYIHEKSNEVLKLENIPITYDETMILAAESKLARIDKLSEITREEWNDGVPFETQQRLSWLVEEASSGSVTISPIGFLFYEKFKTDYPPELPRDRTPPEDKPINLGKIEHHGRDTLTPFAKKLCASPYVKEILNSIPYSPKLKDPIKNCGADGIIELVLVHTDAGYGLRVQSTGRDLKETQYIGRLLRRRYYG